MTGFVRTFALALLAVAGTPAHAGWFFKDKVVESFLQPQTVLEASLSPDGRHLAVIGLIWAVSWAIFGLAGLGLPYDARIACILGFAALFGLGETFMAPTISPLVNSLADDQTRGRANALSTGAYSLAFVVSPTISTGMIAAGHRNSFAPDCVRHWQAAKRHP